MRVIQNFTDSEYKKLLTNFFSYKINNNSQKHQIKLLVNATKKYEVTFCTSRNYISGVTNFLRDYKLLQEAGSFAEKNAEWAIDNEQVIHLKI